MSDEDVRRYARELDRRGLDARKVAAEMLGCTDPERFWLLARRVNTDEPPRSVEAAKTGAAWTRATGVYGSGATERWESLHVLAVVTVEEAVTLARLLAARGHAATLWDRKNGVRANGDGAPYLRVEEGWREPRDGPASYPDVNPVWRRWDEGRTHVRYGDVAFEVPTPPEIQTQTVNMNGGTASLSVITITIPREVLNRVWSTNTNDYPGLLFEPNRALEIDVDERPEVRATPEHRIRPSSIGMNPMRWSVQIGWTTEQSPFPPMRVAQAP